jgi:multicomponent Na+:H+ antiporter subunit D
MPIDLPPALTLLLGAPLVALSRGRTVRLAALVVPALALAHCWMVIGYGSEPRLAFLGLELSPVYVHLATPPFATVFCIVTLAGVWFALERASRVELGAAFVFAGGALGVVFAGDLITMLVFWEIMMLGSTAIIWAGGQQRSYGAGVRYFCLHAVAGAAILVGSVIVIWARMDAGDANPAQFRHFGDMISHWRDFSAANMGAWLVLAGMLVCVGAPPFSAWIADAYPEASVSGAVFLSAFTTKTAVFALIVGFAGFEPLVWVGLWMAMYGITYAVMENDLRRVLSYSIVNQLGLMLVAIGIGTRLAVDGAAAHAFSHIIYKALLMMAAGSVLAVTGKRRLSQVGGLFRGMPVTAACCIVGALAISSFPLTSGFTTKSMIDESVATHANELAQQGEPAPRLIFAWVLLLMAPAGVFLHAWIIPWFAFFGRDSGLRPHDPPRGMQAAMISLAVVCILLGVVPGLLYGILPYEAAAEEYGPKVYSLPHVVEALSLLMFSGLAFFLLLPMLERRRLVTVDFDWVWRRFIPAAWHEIAEPMWQAAAKVRRAAILMLGKIEVPGAIARMAAGAWVVRTSVTAVLLLLLAYLLLFALQSLS